MFTCTPRQNNNWIYKNDPVQKFTYPWILILCIFLDDVFNIFSDTCLSWAGISSSSCTFFGFPASSACLNPLQHWLYDFEIHLLTQLRESCITITKGENMYWCSRRPHNAIRDGWGCICDSGPQNYRSWPVEWSSHPHPECWIPVNFQATTENSTLSTLLDYIKKKKNWTFTFSKSSSFSLSFSPSLASLYLFEQCLRLGVIGTSSVCLPLQD